MLTELLINYAGLLFTAVTTCTYSSEITAFLKPLLSPIYYTTITVFKGIKGIYTFFTSGGTNEGSVDPSTQTPQGGDTENSEQGQKSTPNTSLSPLLNAVDMPENTPYFLRSLFIHDDNSTTTNTTLQNYISNIRFTDLFYWEGEGGSLSRGRWVEKSPTFHERVMRGELTVTRPLMVKYNAAKAFADAENLKLANRRVVRITPRVR